MRGCATHIVCLTRSLFRGLLVNSTISSRAVFYDDEAVVNYLPSLYALPSGFIETIPAKMQKDYVQTNE